MSFFRGLIVALSRNECLVVGAIIFVMGEQRELSAFSFKGESNGVVAFALSWENGMVMNGSIRMPNRIIVVGGRDCMVPWILQWLTCCLSRNERLVVGAL